VRRRWRTRLALRGTAIVLLTGLLTLFVAAYGMDQFRYSPWAVAAFRIFAYAALLGLLLRFLILPLWARVSDERVALYVEEHDPGLDAALVSAVEAAGRASAGAADMSPDLARRLVEQAIEACERVEYARLVERRRLQRVSALLAGTAIAGMLVTLLSPAFFRQAAPYLLAPWTVRAASPYAIEVEPGHAAVARGADQQVVARLKGFDADRVEIAVKGGEAWKRETMADEGASYRFMLLRLEAPTEYFVEASGVRSPVYRIDVAELPYVKRIDLEYRFPAYTGLPPQTVEDGGDVAALRGTTVALRVTPTVPVTAGRLLVEGEPPVALVAGADGRLEASLVVKRDGFYKIELPAKDVALGFTKASADYAIQALEDRTPTVSFLKPGRDTQVTPVEEVFAEVKAEDDYGVGRLELVYSVNGGPEKAVVLHRGRPRGYVSAGHTFFLEELELKPGDFVSYYARATDAATPRGTAATDIYFLEARPFRRDYRQAEQAGGAGMAGQRQGALGAQQRQIIAATFKLLRDRARIGEKAFAEDLATVGLMQGRLRQQVLSLVTRMETRGTLQPGSELHETAAALRSALPEMEAAESELARKQPKEALPPEQRALAHLQHAEGAFREVMVAFGAGGGGGGDGASAEELADLFELELDKLRNQYETVQRGEQEKADQQVDEALERLKELARRQEQENERRRQTAGRLPNQPSGGGGGSQRELAEQAEELGRRLERLARERTSPALEETARRLRDAADAMRRSAANPRDAGASGSAALDRLKEARRLLDSGRRARLDRDLREAQQRAQELAAAQARIAGEVGQGATSGQRLDRLSERKDTLEAGVRELEGRLDRMARDARGEQNAAARKLQEAANAIREGQLKEKIRYSKGVVRSRPPEAAREFEAEIASQIEGLGRRLQDAATSLGRREGDRLAEALDKTRSLVRNLQSLEERLRDRAPAGRQGDQEGRGRSPQQEGGRGEPGERSAEGERGRGERPGEAGGGPGRTEGDRGGAEGGPSAEGGGSGGRPRMTAEDARQLRRELRERIGEGQDLARELRGSGQDGADLEAILKRLRSVEMQNGGDPLGRAELLAAVVEDLKLFEYRLRRSTEAGDALFRAGSEDLPPEYKALVEEYYRSLARKP
jgi:hypothetical protein